MLANNFIIIFSGCLEPIKWRKLCGPFCIAVRTKSRKTVPFREKPRLLRCRKYMWNGWRWMPWSGPSKYVLHLLVWEWVKWNNFFIGIRTQCSACLFWGNVRQGAESVFLCVLFCIATRARSRKTVFFMRKLFLGRCRNTCVIWLPKTRH